MNLEQVHDVLSASAKAHSMLLAPITSDNKFIKRFERSYLASVLENTSILLRAYLKNTELHNKTYDDNFMQVQTESLYDMHKQEKTLDKAIEMDKVTARMTELQEEEPNFSETAYMTTWAVLRTL